METLWALVIGLMLVVGIDFAVRVIRTSVAERFGVATEADIDHAVFRNLLRTSANRMPSLGPVLEKYKQVLSYRDMLSSSLLISLADLPFLLLFLAAIALQSGPLVLVSVVCGGLTVVATLMCHVPVLRYDLIARQAGEKRFGLLSDLLGSREAVIGGAFRASLANRWRQASVAAASAASRARYWRSLGGALSSALSYISFVAVIVGGVYMIEDRTLTSGGLLAASMLTSRVMSMFGAAAGLHLRWGELRMAIRELDQTVPQVVESRADRRYGRLKGAVRFEHVTCRLRQGDKPVLADVSLTVGAGEIVGIAGSPGCGKTTLLRLLAGVIEPDAGRLLLDDVPIGELSEDDVTVNIGYKPQEFALFDGSIIDNVLAGRPSPSPDSMRGLLLATGLAATFDAGALNWHTDIGPRGSRLSGGQRQLVALARSFVGGPPLLLLDEPSNGLDAPLENHLARQIAALRGRATVFVSTHSRTLLLACDRIIVLGDGRLLANGPRDKVLMPAATQS